MAERAGIVTRNLLTGKIESYAGDAVLLCDRRLFQRLFPVNERGRVQRHGHISGLQTRREFRQPVLHPNPSDLHPGHRRSPVEADADVGIAAQRWPHLGAGQSLAIRVIRTRFPTSERDYYLERKYPSFGNLAPRDIARRAAKQVCDEGRGVGPGGRGVYLDFADAISRLGKAKVAEKYGNLFDMYVQITGENGYERPMRIYPALHYTMGGLWVDYNLMSKCPACSSSARRTSPTTAPIASAPALSCKAWPTAISSSPTRSAIISARASSEKIDTGHPEFKPAKAEASERTNKLLSIKGKRTPIEFHRELGRVVWDYVRHGPDGKEPATKH